VKTRSLSVVVRLDDPRFGAGPGTVIAIVETVAEYLAIRSPGRTGYDPALRMRKAYPGAAIGDRVQAMQYGVQS